MHVSFGYLLLLGSASRLLTLATPLTHFEFLAAFFTLCSGLILCSAYDEWIDLLIVAGIDRLAYLGAVGAFGVLIMGWTVFWGGMWVGSVDNGQVGRGYVSVEAGDETRGKEAELGVVFGVEEDGLDLEELVLGKPVQGEVDRLRGLDAMGSPVVVAN